MKRSCRQAPWSLHDTENLVQQTFPQAWKGYAPFEGKSSIPTWLYRSSTNT
ncbi:hypothetical protein DIJ64_14315 [Mycobacterium leprae]|uniref:Uncharacterized protein n=1 Tax=Mycobacterium leprae TaxID=1769 RepID=A0AAD2JEE9_MYCLR|nr:hypothetical protein DIJ64_14315 [Mycobacterium leprae]